MITPYQFGKESENQALQWFLENQKSSLIARNYRCRGGEIDLVFEEWISPQKLELVFVEVRARSPGAWLNALETLDSRKQKRLRKTAESFLARYQGRAQGVRLDLLYLEEGNWKHLRNLWLMD